MKTTETKLLTVQVPLDAFEFKTEYEDKYSMLYFKQKSKPDNNPFSTVPTYDDWHFGGVIMETGRKDGTPKIVFVTTIHKGNGQIVFSPGFEPEKYVERLFDHAFRYRDYTKSDEHGESKSVWNLSATDSFLSRIKAENGYYFDNPLGEEPLKPVHPIGSFKHSEWQKKHKAWQEAESKVVKNKLVVLGIKAST